MQQLLQNVKTPNPEKYKLALPTAEGLTFIKVDEVMYLRASGNYTEIFMANGQKHLVSRHLKEYDDLAGGAEFFPDPSLHAHQRKLHQELRAG